MLRAEGKSTPRSQAGSNDTLAAIPAAVTPDAADPDRLPFEPASPPQAGPADGAALAGELEQFYRHGRMDAGDDEPAPEGWPALLHPYRELTRVRHPYPLCLETGGADAASPLSTVIDGLLEDLGRDGDAGERAKRNLYRLEAELRALADERPGQRLGVLWERAAARLLATSKLSQKKKQVLAQDLAAARDVLATDGELLPCGRAVPRRLFAATLAAWWPQHAAPWRERIDPLIVGLENILRADFGHSPEAFSSTHLRDTVGQPAGADMDFDKMSDLLSRARLGEPLPAERRTRLERTLATLRALRPLFEPGAPVPGGDRGLPFPLDPVDGDCAAAAAGLQRRQAAMVDLARAARIGALELGNRYRAEIHDRRFQAFAVADLSAEEMGAGPPLVLHLAQEALGRGDVEALLELLSSGQPLKVVLALDDLAGEELTHAPPWAARLARLAMAFNDVFVLQCPVSRPDLLQSGFRAGLDYPGPALFSIYTGAGAHARLPAYLDAAAAADCRAFPAFRFDPGAGATLADRMALMEPPGPQPWPREALRYRAADGTERETEAAFTPADFLYCDRRLSRAFRPLPAACERPVPVAVAEFIDLDEAAAAAAIPALEVVAPDGELTRVAVSGAIGAAVARVAADWRALKETAGIDNSFAQALVAQERQRLERDFDREVERIEADYERRLERDIGELTREIVERIAAALLGGAAAPAAVPAPRPAPEPEPADAAAAPAPDAAAPAPADEEDEDEGLSLDEPYIDTPLCTSCDDCTNMSPQIFAYDDNKQAYIKDARAGTYRELVLAAEKCPVKIIHPGKPLNPDEAQLEEWVERARPFS